MTKTNAEAEYPENEDLECTMCGKEIYKCFKCFNEFSELDDVLCLDKHHYCDNCADDIEKFPVVYNNGR